MYLCRGDNKKGDSGKWNYEGKKVAGFLHSALPRCQMGETCSKSPGGATEANDFPKGVINVYLRRKYTDSTS